MEIFLKFLGTNVIVLGFCSFLSIIGFIITGFTWLRTAKISKILEYNSITSQYNKQRKAYAHTFEGHRISIIEDNNRSDALLKDILKHVESYDANFRSILSIKEKIYLWHFKFILKKPATNVDFNTVINHLARLAGRLSKKEEMKNV